MGSPSNAPPPAPVSSSVTDTGRSNRTQCQNPLPVGASGSKHVTAKLFVPSGNPSHRSCGERSPPDFTWASPRSAPGARSALVTVKPCTSGWKSWGSGGLLSSDTTETS